MFLLNGNPLPLDTPFTANDIQYPANWLRLASDDEKSALGIVESPDPERYDDRFYWGVGNPKDLTQLKAQWIAQVDQATWQLLNPTDWMDSRKANDSEYNAPAEWLTWRSDVRAAGKTAKAAIQAAATVEELIPLTSVNFPNDPAHIAEGQG